MIMNNILIFILKYKICAGIRIWKEGDQNGKTILVTCKD